MLQKFRIFNRISSQEKLDFTKNLSLLIKSGKPINEALALLAEEEKNTALVEVIKKARERIERGTPLYQVFDESPYFEKIFVSFIRTGEESGSLETNLKNLSDWLERSNTLKKELSSATLYPKIVILFACLLGGGLAFVILPQLVPVFATLDVELPFTTRALLFASELIEDYGFFVVLFIAIMAFLTYFSLKIKSVRAAWDAVKLKIPVLGGLTKDYELTIICQLMTTLFKSGMTINHSLDIVADSVSNTKYRESLKKIKGRVLKGTSLADAIKEHDKLYPGVFISVVRTGEQTGTYGESFTYLGDFFSGKVSEKTKKLPTVLEPIILILIGIFVAFIATAIILPIYQVTQGIY